MVTYVAYRHFAVLAEALKILQELLCVLGKAMTPELPKVMAAVWQLFEAAPAAFEALVLPHPDRTDEEDQHAEGEGVGSTEVTTFETVVEQLYEFLLTVLSAPSLQDQLRSALHVMTFNTITFMQVPLSSCFHLESCMPPSPSWACCDF
jgi:hypothetical protein